MDEKLATKIFVFLIVFCSLALLILDMVFQIFHLHQNKNDTVPLAQNKILYQLINASLAHERT